MGSLSDRVIVGDGAGEEKPAENIPRHSSAHVRSGKVENANSEYLLFLELNGHFSGKRLQKLVRKVE